MFPLGVLGLSPPPLPPPPPPPPGLTANPTLPPHTFSLCFVEEGEKVMWCVQVWRTGSQENIIHVLGSADHYIIIVPWGLLVCVWVRLTVVNGCDTSLGTTRCALLKAAAGTARMSLSVIANTHPQIYTKQACQN